ncbi:MAG: sugar phosphate isomerase/epimerase [Lachnospiraceae bacterium]|jgi:sugar phosphate isomerase/epimerase|nr:sugar phosphate isomerase/epimerase [Lachnospiraceae bacterium]
MQLGIRAHDVAYAPFEKLVPAIRDQGFTCMHIALSKSIREFTPGISAMTPGLAMYMKRICAQNGIDIAVLGNYLNLCHPDPEEYRRILKKYVAHLRFASILGCGVVGTETGACNEEYRFEPYSHSEEALKTFIERLQPAVEAAERFGVILAIEPVWKHIVCDPKRARRVLDEIDSPNLQIIFDPVNLLCRDNMDRQDDIIRESFDLLCEDIAVVHLKDFVPEGEDLKSVESGAGQLDYPLLLKLIREHKPYVQCTMEDTRPENAVRARKYVQEIYDNL